MKRRLLVGFVVGAVAGAAATVAVMLYTEQESPIPVLPPIVVESQEASCSIQEEYTLYFVDENHPAYHRNCGAATGMTREINHCEIIADALMRALLTGVTDEEREKGLKSTAFTPAYWYHDDTSDLLAYYEGIDIRDGVAFLSFSEESRPYIIEATACMHEAIKLPIKKTLTELKWITDVEYVVGGQHVTEWDA